MSQNTNLFSYKLDIWFSFDPVFSITTMTSMTIK